MTELIDNVNFWLTLISIIVTIVSIGCSVWSMCSAKKAKKYMNKARQLTDCFDIMKLRDDFERESRFFMNNTRKEDWYKGIDSQLVITPLYNVLLSFSSIYIFLESGNDIKDRVNKVIDNIQNYESATLRKKKEINKLIIEILELLNNNLYKIKTDVQTL